MAEPDVILDEEEEEGQLVSLSEVKTMLEEAAEEREELTYEQKIALEHARRFARVDEKAAKAIIDDIMKAFPQIDRKFAYRIADLVPQDPDDVASIFLKSRQELSPEECEKVVEIIDQHYIA